MRKRNVEIDIELKASVEKFESTKLMNDYNGLVYIYKAFVYTSKAGDEYAKFLCETAPSDLNESPLFFDIQFPNTNSYGNTVAKYLALASANEEFNASVELNDSFYKIILDSSSKPLSKISLEGLV